MTPPVPSLDMTERSASATARMPVRLADTTGRKNMQLLIQLRWIAVIGQIVTIEFAFYGLGIQLPLRTMLAALGILLAFNVVSLLRWRELVSQP